MNVPYTAVNVPVYESAKKLLGKAGEEEGLLAQLTAGCAAGASAALLTNPLDVVKTRLQLEGVNSATRYGTTAVVSVSLGLLPREATRKYSQPRRGSTASTPVSVPAFQYAHSL
jgi:Mitochondrial carrier protein